MSTGATDLVCITSNRSQRRSRASVYELKQDLCWGVSAPKVSRSGEMAPTLRIECFNFGPQATVALWYTHGETSDYEGVCLEELN